MNGRLGAKQPVGFFIVLLILALLAACAPDIARLQRQGNIDQLLKALNDTEDASIRAEAAVALGELEASGAIDPLIARLEDQILAVRQAAAQALCKIGDPRAINSPLLILHEKDPGAQSACSMLLGSPEAIDPLTTLLSAQDPAVRQSAALVLCRIQDPRIIQPVIGLLQVEDEKVRSACRKALVDLGARSVDPLVEALKTADADHLMIYSQVLMEIGEPALDSLIAALSDTEPAIRQIARDALIQMESEAVDPLIAALGDSDRQPAAAALLLEFGEPAIDPLIEALSTEELAAPAAEVLAEFGAPAIAPLVSAIQEHPEIGPAAAIPLLLALKNEHPSLRAAAEDGLAAIGEPAVPLLLDLVKENHTLTVADTIFYANRVVYAPPGNAAGKLVDGGLCTEPGGWKGKIVLCRRGENSFIEKLQNVQDSGGVGAVFYNDVAGYLLPTLGKDNDAEIPAVAISLEQGDYLVKNELGQVAKVFIEDEIKSTAAAQVIEKIGEPAIPHLISALSDDFVFETAQDVLESLGASAVPALLDALQHPDKIVRSRSVSALGNIGDKSAFAPIVAGLHDAQASVRWSAAAALGKFKDPAAIEPLISALRDEDKAVRQAAVDSLAEIGLPAVESLLKIYNQQEFQALRSIVAGGLRDIFGQQSSAIYAAAAKACSGEGLPDAAPYRRSEAGPHPMVVLNKYDQMHSWTLHLPVDWLPYTPDQLQVVICMEGQERNVVQVCGYRYRNTGISAPNIIRYRYVTAGAIVAASSGAKLAGFNLYGSQPYACPATTSSNTTSIQGGQVGYTDLLKWLKTFGIPLIAD